MRDAAAIISMHSLLNYLCARFTRRRFQLFQIWARRPFGRRLREIQSLSVGVQTLRRFPSRTKARRLGPTRY